jgi:hypothetical protein
MLRRLVPRRRQRNPAANAIEQVALRVLTAAWILRMLLRHGRPFLR